MVHAVYIKTFNGQYNTDSENIKIVIFFFAVANVIIQV